MSEAARSYLRFADSYVPEFAPPLILAVGGLMGSGKTTLASAVSRALSGQTLHTDTIRDELANKKKLDLRDKSTDFGEGKYASENRNLVYEEMLRRVPDRLDRNPTIVLDGTFSTEDSRIRVATVADRLNAQWLHVECVCPQEVSLQRMESRTITGDPTGSEGRPDLYRQQLAEYESPPQGDRFADVDTTQPVSRQVESVIKAVRELAAG